MSNLLKINIVLFIVTLLSVLSWFYMTSLSCNYHITTDTSVGTYNGTCQLGQATWIEKHPDRTSIWQIKSWSFAFGDDLYFVVYERKQLLKGTSFTLLDEYNMLNNGLEVIAYKVKKINVDKLLLIGNFPQDEITPVVFNGTFSLLSDIQQNN
ncbi:TPA: hypothetical protein RQK84_000874 [Vibrio vulnificus]|nr:hypothetical protein [Vibrio vulnificus]HDY8012844.1 hypothetical protein [Vibrio vulnificus]